MRVLLSLFAVLALSGCHSETPWTGKDVSGLMPDLEFQLTSEDGQPVTATQYLGQVNLLFFGYTHCPDVCPITLGRLRGLLAKLPQADRQQIQVLFVSVDPKRDSPDQLAEYTDAFGPAFIGLTGSQDQLQALTRRYRTTYGYDAADEKGDYAVSHGSAVYAFDRQGQVRLLLRNEDPAAGVVTDIQRLLAE